MVPGEPVHVRGARRLLHPVASTIDCHPAPGVDATIPASAPDNGDGSYSMNNLEPGTYHCKIYVHP